MLDVTTAVRFRPLKMLISLVFKLALVLVLFEVLLNTLPMFNHANIGMPPPFDVVLRTTVVTPDMHRVHHSADLREANTNFGFCFPWWDRLFGTYQVQPTRGTRT